jgi:hypothetical protein
MSCPHLDGVLKLGFTSSFVPISGFNSSPPHIKASNTVATSSKSSWIKRTQKESDREANTNSGRICQNRTADNIDFFEDLLLLKSKSAKLMKVSI